MNAKQRRKYKRYIKKYLYQNIFNIDLDGIYYYDVFESKLYIDYGKSTRVSDEAIYVTIPKFHLLNKEFAKAGRRGAIQLTFFRNKNYRELKKINGIEEVDPLDWYEENNMFNFPLFRITTNESVYFLQAKAGHKFFIQQKYKSEVYLAGERVETTGCRASTLEEILNDSSVSKELKKQLSFQLDCFS